MKRCLLRVLAAVLLTGGVAKAATSPTIAGVNPPAGTVSNLAQITVTFSEAVLGVSAADFLVNGEPASSLIGSGDTYTFSFTQPAYGAVQITWSTNNGITDLAFPPNAFDATQPGATWQYTLVDLTPPTVANLIPAAGTTVWSLYQIEVFFSEPVANVDASDLLVNGLPATSVDVFPPLQYVFTFPQPPTGTVQIAWSTTNGITDLAPALNRFAGGSWTYLLDTNAGPGDLLITEFLAANKNGIHDEDGVASDWIEIYNPGPNPHNLDGWYLTDDNLKLTKWRFPGVTMQPNSYLVVFASGNDRTNVTGNLHTNFRLNKLGGYLALVDPTTNIISAFTPIYPAQKTDVSYGRDRVNPNLLGYFTTPTPGAPNSTSGSGFAPSVLFSQPSKTFVAPFNLVLSAAATNAVIHYVLGTNLPTESSAIYTNPIPITNTVQVRARAFVPGLFPGDVTSADFIRLDGTSAVLNFTSDLPVVVFHNYGGGTVPSGSDQYVMIEVFEPKSGYSSLTNLPDLTVNGTFHKRGSSTLNYPKSSFAVETHDEFGDNKNVAMVGLPVESDWVFYGIDQFDRVLIHNPMAHALFRQMGYYSSRTKFVEVYVKQNSGTLGPITAADYNGLYVLEEKIKIDKNRVNIDKLQPENTTPPSVTGGYLFSIDRVNAGEQQFTGAGASMNYLSPKYAEMITSQWAPQKQYVDSFFTTFGNALNDPNWTNPVTGYAAYVDVNEWIDFHVHEVVTFNLDALRLSGFFYKPRSGKLTQGPPWDYDRTQGSTDGRDFNPRLWRSTVPDYGTDMFNPDPIFNNPWYGKMFRDIDFWQKWIDHYQQWRKTVFSTNNIYATIDALAAQVRQAEPRDVARWKGSGDSDSTPRTGSISSAGYTYTFPGTYQGEVDFMKVWYSNRLDFLDGQLVSPPTFSSSGGLISSGFSLSITGAPGTIYYTLDGTDPRGPGGSVAAGALAYSGPITLSSNARVVARIINTAHTNLTGSGKPPLSSPWSGPTVETYYTALPTLRITEIMYNPAAPPAGNTNDNDSFEFIEFTNVGTNTLSLVGFHFTTTNGIDFTFTATNNLTNLAPGGRALIVANSNAFVTRYPGLGGLVAGEYGGQLGHVGDRLTLSGPLAEPILDFSYNTNWYPLTDHRGFSLVPVDENAPPSAWNNVTQWRQSTYDGGSPGAPDPTVVAVLPVLVNEVMSHAIPPAGDAIELFNPNPANVDIGFWYLSDNLNIPKKYRIPDGTVIPAFGFVVFYGTNSFGAAGAMQPFGLSANGESAYVFSGDSTAHLTGYYQGHDFGASALGVTFGRYINSVGQVDFVAQSTNTLGFTNAYPLVGPIVISEIMYHPPNLAVGGVPIDNVRDEFIELRNITGAPVPLYDPLHPANTWQIGSVVSFDFPPGVVLPPNGYVLAVSFDPNQDLTSLAAFQARYGLSNNVPIYGPYDGSLSNTGSRIELLQPGIPNPTTGIPPQIEIDRVEYSSLPPWPTNGIGMGASLQRLNLAGYGNDPTNWASGGPTAGSDFVAGPPPTISGQPQPQSKVQGNSASFRVGVTGTGPLTYQWLFNGMAVDGAFSQTLVLNNVQPSQAGAYSVVVFSPGGMATSASATLTVLLLPVIMQAPTNEVKYAGASVTFRVTATGTGPIGYQWQFNTASILGATNSTLTLTSVQPGTNDGNYTVIVTDTIGSVSATATLFIHPVITQQPIPTNQVVAVGGTASFFVSARGNVPMGFRWVQNDTNNRVNILLNTNACVYTLSNVSSNDQGSYKVGITNIAGQAVSYSSKAFLTVLYPPSIVLPPTNQVTAPCSNATLIVSAAGGLLGYQWYFNATNVLAGATNSTLVITNPVLSSIGNYSVTVSNALGVVTSTAASLTILWGDCDTNGLPDLWELIYFGHVGVDPNADPDGDGMLNWQEYVAGTDPLDPHSYLKWDTITLSNTVGLSFLAVSNRTYSVLWKESLMAGQWTKLADVYSSTTNQVVTINDPLPPAEGRIYRLIVPQLPGPTNPMPAILTSPKSAIAELGEPASFNVLSVGNGTPSYQWFFNSNALAGPGGPTYELTAVQDTNVGVYHVTVTAGSATATSGPAWLVLKPWILAQPQSQRVVVGGNVSFSVTAMGTGPLSYRWRHDGQWMAEQTNAVLVLNGVQLEDAGIYSALISQLTPLGTVTVESTNVVLTVLEGP